MPGKSSIEVLPDSRPVTPGQALIASLPESKFRERMRVFLWITILLIVCFARPLYDLLRFAGRSNLYSHILLVPFIAMYLVWLKRRDLAPESETARRLAVGPFVLGLAMLAGYWLGARPGWSPGTENYLAVMTFSFVAFLWTGCFLCFGVETLTRLAFPLGFLIFIVPFPTAVEHGLEAFLQRGSATAACALLKLSGMPVLKDGLELQLPGFSMQVAPECSGIHSSLVLFITSLLAGHLFLSKAWTRASLALVVIPLGILRNGLRICILGQLCVNVSPDWIHSRLHLRGGPLFFAASLVPFFLLLLWLCRVEQRRRQE
jgi:exosortase C (VPDSG-CTERM-specific)